MTDWLKDHHGKGQLMTRYGGIAEGSFRMWKSQGYMKEYRAKMFKFMKLVDDCWNGKDTPPTSSEEEEAESEEEVWDIVHFLREGPAGFRHPSTHRFWN